MKRFFGLILAIVLVFTGSALAEDWSGYTDEELIAIIDELNKLVAEAQAELDSRHSTGATSNEVISGTIKGVAEFTAKVYKTDEKHILVEYNWKNLSDRARKFSTTFSTAAFQNGKELDHGITFSIELNNYDSILPGYSLVSREYFKLDDASDITIVINNWINKGNVNTGLVYTYKLYDLPIYGN